MQYATLFLPATTGRNASSALDATGVRWVRFGDEIFVYAVAGKWSRLAEMFGDVGAKGNVRKDDLHLVTQKGRTFQLEHPDIPVLFDKGRYLVVEIGRAEARKIAGRAEPCFRIEPLRESTTVFETEAARSGRAPRPEIASVVDELDPATLEKALSKLVSFPTRHSTSPQFREATIWARDRLTEACAPAELVEIDVMGEPSWNVVGRKPGKAAGRGAVLVVAHLDSINVQGGPEAPAPGADDNASGSAGLLTLAEVLCRHDYDHDLVFVLFGGEEQGLLGSTQFVASLGEMERQRIRAVLNMDMIGSVNSEPQSVLLEGAELSRAVIDGLADAAAQVTSLNVQISLNPFASDHVPFIDVGVPAVLTIEGADGANEAIHTENDVLSRIDIAYAMEILRMNAAYLAVEAGIATKTSAPSESPDTQPSGACFGHQSAQPLQDRAAVNQLAGHYHALFAQYARLRSDGRLTQFDFDQWQLARAAYDIAIGAPGGS